MSDVPPQSLFGIPFADDFHRLITPISSQVAIVLQDLSVDWQELHMASTIKPTIERERVWRALRIIPFAR